MTKKERVVPHMLKKFASLLLSLLLCLSLLSGQACAAGLPAAENPPAVVDSLDPEEPPVMPLSEAELPDGDDFHHL